MRRSIIADNPVFLSGWQNPKIIGVITRDERMIAMW
jgi:hypothetical protein